MNTSKELDTVARTKIDTLKTYLILRADIIRDDVIQKHRSLKEENRKRRIEDIRQQVIPEPGSSNIIPEFGQEGLHPFSICSPDIWEILLNKYLLDSRTWLNCFYASAALRNEENVLKWQQNKVTRLLPEVLVNLQKTGSNAHLSGYDLKRLRLVSKKFRCIIDNHYAVYRSIDMFYRGSGPRVRLNANNIDKAFPYLTSQTSMPLSFNSFTVDRSISNGDLSKVTYMLEKMGKGIRELSWTTETKCKWDLPCAIQWYATLHSWLVSMPNLEFLDIKYIINKHFEWSFRPKFEKFSNDLEQELSINPLPKLNKLGILIMENTVPSQLVTAILSGSPNVHIVHVEIEYPEMIPEKILGPLWNGYSNLQLDFLTELYIKDYVQHSYFEIRGECSIASLKNVNWPLKTLTLDLSTDPERCYGHQNIQLLFAFANNFGKTLEYLKISGAKWTKSTKTSELQLSSSTLKTLILQMEFESHFAYQPHINIDFDFLLELQALQCLSLKLKDYNSKVFNTVYLEESVQLQDYFHRLYESQIWNLLQTLQTVDLDMYLHQTGGNSKYYTHKYDRIGFQNFSSSN